MAHWRSHLASPQYCFPGTRLSMSTFVHQLTDNECNNQVIMATFAQPIVYRSLEQLEIQRNRVYWRQNCRPLRSEHTCQTTTTTRYLWFAKLVVYYVWRFLQLTRPFCHWTSQFAPGIMNSSFKRSRQQIRVPLRFDPHKRRKKRKADWRMVSHERRGSDCDRRRTLLNVVSA